jgi:hypothetical protein
MRAPVVPWLDALWRRFRPDDLGRYEWRSSSQNGEDGVIAELMRRCGTGSRFFVEIGAGDGQEANCVALADREGWAGVFVEADQALYSRLERKYADVPRVRTVRLAVSPGNVNDLSADAGVPREVGVLSIDIDGADYWVWEALTRFEPRIVVVEYNAALPADRRVVQPLDAAMEKWDGTDYFGASIGALRALAWRKGYVLAHTDRTGCNAFFVRSDLAKSARVPRNPPIHPPNFFLDGRRHVRDRARRPYLDLDRPGSEFTPELDA